MILSRESTEFVTSEYLGFCRLATLTNKLKLIYCTLVQKSSNHGDRKRDKLRSRMK